MERTTTPATYCSTRSTPRRVKHRVDRRTSRSRRGSEIALASCRCGGERAVVDGYKTEQGASYLRRVLGSKIELWIIPVNATYTSIM